MVNLRSNINARHLELVKDGVSKTRLFSISRSIVAGGSFTAYHHSADQSNGTLTTVFGRIVHWFACIEKGNDHRRSSYSAELLMCVRLLMHTRARTMPGCNGIAFRTVVPSINWRYISGGLCFTRILLSSSYGTDSSFISSISFT